MSCSGKEGRALSNCHLLGCNTRPGYDVNCLMESARRESLFSSSCAVFRQCCTWSCAVKQKGSQLHRYFKLHMVFTQAYFKSNGANDEMLKYGSELFYPFLKRDWKVGLLFHVASSWYSCRVEQRQASWWYECCSDSLNFYIAKTGSIYLWFKKLVLNLKNSSIIPT